MKENTAHYKIIAALIISVLLIPIIGVMVNICLNYGRIVGSFGRQIDELKS